MGTVVTTVAPPRVAPLVGPATRTVVHVTGEDRATYLDAVLSQRLRDAAPGTAAGALELGPKGEPTGLLDLAVLDDRIVLLVPPAAQDTLERLAGRTFLSDATFTTTDHAVVRLRGDDLAPVLAEAGLPDAPGSAAVVDDVVVLVGHRRADLAGPAASVAALEARLVDAGATAGDEQALDDAETALGVPRMPDEVRLGRLPEELGLLPTHVHLDKGCYPGQEAVARMWMLGRPRRRLARLALADDVAPGTLGEGRGAVEVTRVAEVDGTRVGLGFVPADAAVGDEPAEGVVVTELVGEGLPVPGHDPAMTRRRDR